MRIIVINLSYNTKDFSSLTNTVAELVDALVVLGATQDRGSASYTTRIFS